MKRKFGILAHLSMLPSPNGIGALGADAVRFIDFLAEAGAGWWQMLPLGPSGFGNSPYQSDSVFAGNPFFVDLDTLCWDGLLSHEDYRTLDWGSDPARVDYQKLGASRETVLRRAFENAGTSLDGEIAAFAEKNRYWLEDYALFCAIRKEQGGRPFYDWPQPLRDRETAALRRAAEELETEIRFVRFVQYEFHRQFSYLRNHASLRGVGLIGDLPIYPAADSCDVWANRELFSLLPDGRPALEAGVPPDAFSEDGQLWGNPVYDWNAMKQADYFWWRNRFKMAISRFDLIRMDHFRGFDEFFAVPSGAESARDGCWMPGPGMELFDSLQREFGPLPVIAEDLGILSDSVRRLLSETGFPGMRVLQFAFTPGFESGHLPHRHPENAVCYTGTHDNDTAAGFLAGLDPESRAFAEGYLRLSAQAPVFDFVSSAFASPCNLCIVPVQDLLALGSGARFNTPGTLHRENWCWRLIPGQLSEMDAKILRKLGGLYFRL